MSNPYQSLPAEAFWKSAVGSRNALEIEDLHRFKFRVDPKDRIITAGSCFAQHIGQALKAKGFAWHDAEPGPDLEVLSPELKRRYGYGVFSFRTGNIYTTALLRQWIRWAFQREVPPAEIWEDADGRFHDPFRPAIEPGGFASRAELLAARRGTLDAIARAVRDCRIFVFTLGLTESWVDAETGAHYPVCPGTAAGTFEPRRHLFRNQSHAEVLAALEEVVAFCREVNPGIRFILTVSPVPLTATASGRHVLVATTHSKSTLRSVAGELADRHDHVDYFPSYEVIASPPFRGMFYQPNQREVSPKGVEVVMSHFFRALADAPAGPSGDPRDPGRSDDAPRPADAVEIQCEEALLEAFGR